MNTIWVSNNEAMPPRRAEIHFKEKVTWNGSAFSKTKTNDEDPIKHREDMFAKPFSRL